MSDVKQPNYKSIRPQWPLGAKVVHWFRGSGVVIGSPNSKTVSVRFKDGCGRCYPQDLQAENPK